MKTSDLTGPALDWAVCHAEGTQPGRYTQYSTDWRAGGPIIEREWIELTINTKVVDGAWLATRVEGSVICEMTGPTQLVAAMRCYVASQLGDEVEVPFDVALDSLIYETGDDE